MSNPPKIPTDKELEEIEALAGLGLRYEDIARLKGICVDTVKKYAHEQLERGKAKTKAQVMQTAYKLAVSGKNPVMTMFWLKTRAGWREGQPDCETPENNLINGEGTERKTSSTPPSLAKRVQESNKPTQILMGYLAETLEQVKQGALDPQIASSISSVARTLMKAAEQGDLEERLASLEALIQSQSPHPLELDLDTL